MSFISYAQNFEDIILWRVFKDIASGFYIDVGANDPTIDSVTKAFYDRGWRGINVEPMPQYYRRLAIGRPADINLPVAVGETEGELVFHDVADTGLSTLDAGIAATHAAVGRKVTRWPVRIRRLTDICAEHVTGPIHFLKIDVEGFEAEVLRGMDFQRWRPWVLVIEATRPQSQTRNNAAWRDLVLSAGYSLVYFDGLNDYYLASEHAERLPAFDRPPNFFDGFTLCEGHFFSHPVAEAEHRVWLANVRLEAAEKKAHEADEWGRHATVRAEHAEANALQAQTELASANALVHSLSEQHAAVVTRLEAEHARTVHLDGLLQTSNAALAAMHASASWRVTAPLRLAKRTVRHPRRLLGRLYRFCKAPVRSLRILAGRLARRAARDERLRTQAMRYLGGSPTVVKWVDAFYLRFQPVTLPEQTPTAVPLTAVASDTPQAVLLAAEIMRRRIASANGAQHGWTHADALTSSVSAPVSSSHPSNASIDSHAHRP